jgi:RNA polymerase sigma factor
LKEKFIENYKPFIIKTVSRVTGKYVQIENSEEYSIGLIAFNEAIETFDEHKNPSFLNFCKQVIKRRIIDYIRKNKKNRKVYPFTYFENNDRNSLQETILKEDDSDIQLENIEIKDQIEIFEKKLQEFGITLNDLVLCSPKHRDSKQMAIKIAYTLAENDDLYRKLMKNKKIPMGNLMEKIDINQRTVERNRKFIIAVCLILKSNLDILKGYIANAKEGRGYL